jgi:hypothetical protein
LQGNWSVRTPSEVPAMHLLIVDGVSAVFSDMAVDLGATLDDWHVYLAESASDLGPLMHLFDAAWSSESDLIYQDLSCGASALVQSEIAIVSSACWQRLFRDLLADPRRVYGLTSRKLEELVAELAMRDGMEVHLTPAQRDGGRDVVAYLDTEMGRHLFLIECKKYAPEYPVDVRLVRELFGVVEAEQATGGLLVTTSRFTSGALQFRESVSNRMSLKDFSALSDWIRKHSA